MSIIIAGYLLILLAGIYVALSIVLQRKLSNPKRLREIQEIIKEKTKELNELAKSRADPKALADKQKELMPLLNETMKLQFKPLLVVLPIFIALYYLILPMAFKPYSSARFSFLSLSLNYQLYFVLFTFLFGIIASAVVALYDRAKAKKELKGLNSGP